MLPPQRGNQDIRNGVENDWRRWILTSCARTLLPSRPMDWADAVQRTADTPGDRQRTLASVRGRQALGLVRGAQSLGRAADAGAP